MAGYGSQEGRIVFFVRGEVAEPASGEIVEGAREGGARAVRVTRSEGVGGGGSERGPEGGRGWGGSYIEWGGCSSTNTWNKERVGGRRREEMRCALAYD